MNSEDIIIRKIPDILLEIKEYLQSIELLEIDKKHDDGRINSCFDETTILTKILQNPIFKDKINLPKHRMWYDFLIKDKDDIYIPVNIKSTTTETSDNIGNLSLCLYAYTNHEMDLFKNYTNGKIADILYKKLANQEYNNSTRDYYFIVVNKNNTKQIILNSMLGINIITPNINNLPFQVKWKNNKEPIYKDIESRVKQFIRSINSPNKNWQEKFLDNMRKLTI